MIKLSKGNHFNLKVFESRFWIGNVQNRLLKDYYCKNCKVFVIKAFEIKQFLNKMAT